MCDVSGDYVDSPGSFPEGTVMVDDSQMEELRGKMDCHNIETDPASTPDYESNCGDSTVCEDAGGTFIDNNGVERTCSWVVTRDKCGQFGNLCEQSCGICDGGSLIL